MSLYEHISHLYNASGPERHSNSKKQQEQARPRRLAWRVGALWICLIGDDLEISMHSWDVEAKGTRCHVAALLSRPYIVLWPIWFAFAYPIRDFHRSLRPIFASFREASLNGPHHILTSLGRSQRPLLAITAGVCANQEVSSSTVLCQSICNSHMGLNSLNTLNTITYLSRYLRWASHRIVNQAKKAVRQTYRYQKAMTEPAKKVYESDCVIVECVNNTIPHSTHIPHDTWHIPHPTKKSPHGPTTPLDRDLPKHRGSSLY